MDPEELPLRDIHLPEPIAWWPPAPGWWILGGVLVLVLGIVGWRYYRARTRVRRSVRREFARLARNYASDADGPALLQGLSVLLRRAALTAEQRREVAALNGDDWLRYLDAGLEDRPFSEGPGSILADGPYRDPAALSGSVDLGVLLKLCRRRLAEMPL